MNNTLGKPELPPWAQYWFSFRRWKIRLLIFLSIFGPATIAAMADNDATGVATYAISGAQLGYPILFALVWITLLLALTQEMGMRLSLVSRKGLGDLIREYHGVKAAIWIFLILFIANMGTIIADIAAFKTSAEIFHLPAIPLIIILIVVVFFSVTAGTYKSTQNIMLLSSLFYIAYIFSAFKANPDWNLALSNLAWPNGLNFTSQYWKSYIIVGLGVLGTTITPWGQFFISSFGLDKKIDPAKLKYSQLETYWGAFLTDFFSFFMIVATSATLFVHGIAITDGTKAALAIQPFAGKLAATLFALGIMNAGFMGIVIVGLSTTYAFSEFFGYSGGLDTKYHQSRTFYVLFLIQLLLGFLVVMIPSVNLFAIVIATQILNAMALPPIFYYLIKFTSHRDLMGEFTNNAIQKYGAIVGTVIITLASLFAISATIFRW
ncbi:divalent metal cation transporter [Candidatus Gottesmanbacteria bacterium]|nr:divalent metal cation transporter [Candidatus Gottesmanbacteria bacterium]